MFRMWIKEIQDNHLIKDLTICDDSDETRTHKVFNALEKAIREFDLPRPIWLDSNVSDFKRHSHTRFTQDSFIEELEFDYLEIQMIEED